MFVLTAEFDVVNEFEAIVVARTTVSLTAFGTYATQPQL